MGDVRTPLCRILVTAAAACLAMPGMAIGAAAPAPAPIVEAVIACRDIADATARLACFDSSVAKLGSSQTSGDLVVVDREQIKQARRSLFGLTLPQLSLFGPRGGGKPGGAPADSELQQIVGTVRAVSQNAEGGWIVVLEDGARWEQTDSTSLGRFPKVGSTVLIKKAAFSSYKMQIDHGVFIQARRLN